MKKSRRASNSTGKQGSSNINQLADFETSLTDLPPKPFNTLLLAASCCCCFHSSGFPFSILSWQLFFYYISNIRLHFFSFSARPQPLYRPTFTEHYIPAIFQIPSYFPFFSSFLHFFFYCFIQGMAMSFRQYFSITLRLQNLNVHRF